MENTCNFDKCKFGRKHFEKAEECFNYRETWWTPGDKSAPVMVSDCCPIRTMIMVQDLFNRQIGLQEAQEQQRNQAVRVMDFADGIVQYIREKIDNEHPKLLVETNKK